jgi:hypothetical protein
VLRFDVIFRTQRSTLFLVIDAGKFNSLIAMIPEGCQLVAGG